MQQEERGGRLCRRLGSRSPMKPQGPGLWEDDRDCGCVMETFGVTDCPEKRVGRITD